ncbi:STAS domain-containing protein [Pseudothermotoga thermarum]|uniref:Anti-sigma factor antagonist n=1 Tax=Pseudothermotoga thermarum DSM 5069 TaxID=688269 RepID=F7YVB0_9THEM|nr:STAS domain-containing protein [Pseudothermotoga thermarum]AEH50413.1 anti-sigma-factor antagonist [Pseudothermotoga thermarum DSM 5069]
MIGTSVKFEQIGSKLVCRINGDIDAYHSADVKKAIKDELEKTSAMTVILDMSQVPYVDSAGLGTMVALLKVARTLNKELVLASLRQNVKRVFEMTRLDKVFKITDTVEEV